MNYNYLGHIDRLIAEHQSILDALKLTRDLLDGKMRAKKQKTNGALAEALVAEAEAHRSHHTQTPGTRGPYKKKQSRQHPPHGRHVIAKRRALSEEFLAQFDRKVPSRPPSLNGNGHLRTALGPMVRRGYLAKKGGGYIRTAKPYIVNPKDVFPRNRNGAKTPKKGWDKVSVQSRRKVSAEFLQQFNRDTPIEASGLNAPMFASMIRFGYIKKQGTGYVRTAKEFSVVKP